MYVDEDVKPQGIGLTCESLVLDFRIREDAGQFSAVGEMINLAKQESLLNRKLTF
jgi:hypothetical protein